MSRFSNGVKSRSSSKSGLKKRTTFSIWEAEFFIQEDKNKPSYVEFKVEKYIDASSMGQYQIKMGLISCWLDTSTNYCVKAHLYPSRKSLTQINFFKDLQSAGEVEVSSAASGSGSLTLLAADQMIQGESAIRYGVKSQGTYHHRGSYLDEFQSYYIYDSKAIALLSLIDHLRIRKTIGGLSMVNFMRIPDDVLQSVGYEAVPDLLGRGFPMWKGNPESVTEASAQGYGSMRWDKQAANAESFLELLQGIIS